MINPNFLTIPLLFRKKSFISRSRLPTFYFLQEYHNGGRTSSKRSTMGIEKSEHAACGQKFYNRRSEWSGVELRE